MIDPTALSSRQIVAIFALGFGGIIELYCGSAVLLRDPQNQANRFTSLAYLSLALAMGFNVIYVLLTDDPFVSILHRITVLFSIVAGSFLFLSALYISEGYESFKSYRIMIIAFNMICSISILVIPGVIVYTGETALPGSEQFIEWSIIFFLFAALPIYLTLSGTCYYYLKVWIEVPFDSPIKQACLLVTLGTIFLGLSHFLIIVPHILISEMIKINTLVLIGNLGSVGALIASLFIFLGYRTKILRKSEPD
ncbi:MAG: hypothetical protein ACFE95_12725 [Candidatus Hodarchaeota archaeon]